jgi:hypothetical protein
MRGLQWNAKYGGLAFAPIFFLYEELAGLSLQTVRHAASVAASNGTAGLTNVIRPFAQFPTPPRRNATFLRYLVGNRLETGALVHSGRPEYAAVGERIRRLVVRMMPQARHVETMHSEHFHEALYRGSWMYQCSRLREMALAIERRELPLSALNALITTVSTRRVLEFRVAFFSNRRRMEHGTYLLRTRPIDDPRACVERIRANLLTLGVGNVVCQSMPMTTMVGGSRKSLQHPAALGLKSAKLTLPL